MIEVIKFLGGSTILLGAIAWLLRSIITHSLLKEAETFKASIRLESEKELQKTANELRITSLEKEHKSAILQAKRAEITAELYRLLVEFVGAAQSYASSIEYTGEPDKNEKNKIYADAANEFRKYFLTNRIYFPSSICERIDSLFKKTTNPLQKYTFWRAREDRFDQAVKKTTDAWLEASDTMSKKIPPLLIEIENEFRQLIGVSE